jgi:bacterioferritin-associated ferredoxin
MLVCHCLAIRSRDIEVAIACGARTPREITLACGAGGGCGGCRPVIEELLSTCASDARPRERTTLRHEEYATCRVATQS